MSNTDLSTTYTVYIESVLDIGTTTTDLFKISYTKDSKNKVTSTIKLTPACQPSGTITDNATHTLSTVDTDLDANEWLKEAAAIYSLKEKQTLKLKKNPAATATKEETKQEVTNETVTVSTGVIMNWALVPVEEQKPQINWRQDINSDDKPLSKLASFQTNSQNLGSNYLSGCSLKAGNLKDYMEKNYEEMKAGKVGSEHIPNEYSIEDRIENNFLQQMVLYGYQPSLEKLSAANNVDPLLVAAIITTESGGYPESNSGSAQGLMQLNPEYFTYRNTNNPAEDAIKNLEEAIPYLTKKVPSETKVSNVCVNCMGYNFGPARLINSLSKKDSSNSSNGGTTKPNITDAMTWCDLYEYMGALPSETLQYFPKVVYAYHCLLQHINQITVLDKPDGGMCFPIGNEYLDKTYYYKRFGIQNQNSGVTFVSDGITLKVPKGTPVMTADMCTYTYGEEKDGIHGKFVTITCVSGSNAGYKVTYCNLSEFKKPEATKDDGYYAKGSVIGLSGVAKNGVESLSIVVKDTNDKPIDPTSDDWWSILSGVYSEDASVSIGEYNKKK